VRASDVRRRHVNHPPQMNLGTSCAPTAFIQRPTRAPSFNHDAVHVYDQTRLARGEAETLAANSAVVRSSDPCPRREPKIAGRSPSMPPVSPTFFSPSAHGQNLSDPTDLLQASSSASGEQHKHEAQAIVRLVHVVIAPKT